MELHHEFSLRISDVCLVPKIAQHVLKAENDDIVGAEASLKRKLELTSCGTLCIAA